MPIHKMRIKEVFFKPLPKLNCSQNSLSMIMIVHLPVNVPCHWEGWNTRECTLVNTLHWMVYSCTVYTAESTLLWMVYSCTVYTAESTLHWTVYSVQVYRCTVYSVQVYRCTVCTPFTLLYSLVPSN